MLRKTALFVSLLLLIGILFCACAPDYRQSAVIGSYTDLETGSYSLTLFADGTGKIVHTSVLGIVTEENVVFEIDGEYVDLLGKMESGGVIGRNEYSARIEGEGEAITLTFKATDSGVLLGTFVKNS